MLLFGIGTAAGGHGWLRLPARTRLLQGRSVPGGGSRRTRDRHARRRRSLGGLRRTMPRTAVGAALAAGSMAGIPLFVGFIAKEQFYDSVRSLGASRHLEWHPRRRRRGGEHVPRRGRTDRRHRAVSWPFMPTPASHDAPASLWLGPMILGALGVDSGRSAGARRRPDRSRGGVCDCGTVSAVTFALWHGFTTTLALSALTLAGSVALFTLRTRLWRLAWPTALHAERLYSVTLAVLDSRQPSHRSGAAERVAAFVRAHGRRRRRSRWSHLRLPPTAPFRRRDAGRQSRFHEGRSRGADRRRSADRRPSRDRRWLPSCRWARSVTASP